GTRKRSGQHIRRPGEPSSAGPMSAAPTNPRSSTDTHRDRERARPSHFKPGHILVDQRELEAMRSWVARGGDADAVNRNAISCPEMVREPRSNAVPDERPGSFGGKPMVGNGHGIRGPGRITGILKGEFELVFPAFLHGWGTAMTDPLHLVGGRRE